MRKAGWTQFSIIKAADGGTSQKNVKDWAERHGLNVRFGQSIFVNHYGAWLNTENRRKVNKFMKECLGW